MTPLQASEELHIVLSVIRRLRGVYYDRLNRADLTEARACLEDVAQRLREDTRRWTWGWRPP